MRVQIMVCQVHNSPKLGLPPGAPGKITIMRAAAVFDGTNADELALARAQWKELKDLGFALTYWQQGANGRWEMKS